MIIIHRSTLNREEFIGRVEDILAGKKYIAVSNLEKKIIFYGTNKQFEAAVKDFPNTRFKLFIDCTVDDGKILKYLKIPQEIVLST